MLTSVKISYTMGMTQKKWKSKYQPPATLGDLFAGLPVKNYPEGWSGLKRQAFHRIRIDSRRVEPGDIFIAVRGYETDGHRYLSQAVAKGAVALVVEERDETLSTPQILVENSRAFQADLACRYYGNPSHQLKLCGITGSNGKTSTSLMYRQIIQETGEACGLLGTVAYEAGSEQVSSAMTTPDSLDLQRYLRQMVDRGIPHAVMEVSSIGLHQDRVKNTQFDRAVLLNLTHEHLDYHGSIEHYFQQKKKLLTSLSPEGVAVLNADDPYSRSLQDELACRVLTFGLKNQADIRAENLDLSTGFAHFDLVINPASRNSRSLSKDTSTDTFLVQALTSGRYPVALQVPGLHSVYNALAAISLALSRGIAPELCCRAISKFRGVERRFQQIYQGDFRVFDDHFANTKNIDMTLSTLQAMDYNRLVIVYAIRGNRGPKVNRENIETLNTWLSGLKIRSFIPSLSRDVVGHYDIVKPEEISVFQATMRENDLSYELQDTLEAAIDLALQVVQPGDIILLAGCQGMDAGGRLILHKLAEQYPACREAILAPLQDRVCGW